MVKSTPKKPRTLISRFNESESANMGQMMGLVGIAVVALILAVILEVGPIVGYNTEGAVTMPTITAASGTLTFTGNVSNGDLVNITSGTGVYLFEFNTTNNGSTIVCRTNNCIPVNLTGTGSILWNQSQFASGNLTAAINGNATVAALVTAANTTNVTTITADTSGTSGNSIGTTENTAGASWGGSSLSGGVDGSNWDTKYNRAITNGSEVWGQLTPMIAVAGIIGIVGVIIVVLFGILVVRKNNGGGGL